MNFLYIKSLNPFMHFYWGGFNFFSLTWKLQTLNQVNVSPRAPPHNIEKDRGHCVPVWQYFFETSRYWNTSSWQMIAIKSPVHSFPLPSDGVSLGSSWELVLLHRILGIQSLVLQWVTVWSLLPLNTVFLIQIVSSKQKQTTAQEVKRLKRIVKIGDWWICFAPSCCFCWVC